MKEVKEALRENRECLGWKYRATFNVGCNKWGRCSEELAGRIISGPSDHINTEMDDESMVQNAIAKLVQYGLATGLIEKGRQSLSANRLLELLKIDALESETEEAIRSFDPADQSVVSQLKANPWRDLRLCV